MKIKHLGLFLQQSATNALYKTENVRLSYISEHDRYGFNTQKDMVKDFSYMYI